MIKSITLATMIVLLCCGASCSHVPPQTAVIVDPSLKVRCPELPTIGTQTITMGDLYTRYSDLQEQYIQCAIRNDCLIEAIGVAESDPKNKGTVTISCPAVKKE